MTLFRSRATDDSCPPEAALGTQDLVPLVYDELRDLARAHLRGERPEHTLQATAVVHEVYLRLAGSSNWQNRAQFVAIAAETIRRILVNHAADRRAGSSEVTGVTIRGTAEVARGVSSTL